MCVANCNKKDFYDRTKALNFGLTRRQRRGGREGRKKREKKGREIGGGGGV